MTSTSSLTRRVGRLKAHRRMPDSLTEYTRVKRAWLHTLSEEVLEFMLGVVQHIADGGEPTDLGPDDAARYDAICQEWQRMPLPTAWK